MADYTLYYWPLPFRGQFVRAVLSHIGASWHEAEVEAVAGQRAADPQAQLVPHMGPPLLIDHVTKAHLSQMPAILAYLGAKHGLLPGDPVLDAMSHKIVADANDVLYEMTRYNGAQLWTEPAWKEFKPRLCRWMELFEETGRRHGLTTRSGFMLGTSEPGIADIVAATLWGTMTAKFVQLRPMLDRHAPSIAGLSDRIAALPAQTELRKRSADAYGDEWCGGQIEASLRAVLGPAD
ncbi:MAG: glutathione S-transferase [Hoeflea sp.]|uniref:glutathione S-transferase n=1 Tax=Hoeflea sp. TaxID=1940281 RepID=UPI001DD387FB|nr:glutathione S-transferase [Hoeflea sp.]MBU4528567.1 glutathione S-transferase [Alphaproteobacteria bacterium]MBU4545628.1 glutathione S-transferase [Alphaproteobacteria bacterium]MBU4552238.1 glutathione S-transferase [Alphaproteobacteria bacterium]MBV1726170.1 glutathione S-transferase [Hoeflea sp.]MBV1762403.1 glutathione S-transferase [Hoeflea sp.]